MVHTLLVSVPLCWPFHHCVYGAIQESRKHWAFSPETPKTCAPLVQALAREQPGQERAAWTLEMQEHSRLGHRCQRHRTGGLGASWELWVPRGWEG